MLFLIPTWLLAGIKGQALREKEKTLRDTLRTGTAPVGIGAALATLLLVVVFLLI